MPEGSESIARTLCVDIEAHGAIEHAVSLLQGGELISFPTDTVYGIGAHAYQPRAVQRLYELKNRPAHLPIPLLLSDVTALAHVCVDIPPIAWRLAASFWPGGLSLVLYCAPVVPDVVTSGGATVAVRVPDQIGVRELCRRLASPLAATSANLHGEPPPLTAEAVRDAFGMRIPLILDGGRCRGDMASTVLDLTVTPPAILREGPISEQQLREAGALWVD